MAYTEANDGDTLATPTGNIRITAQTNRALTSGQRQVLRRTCARFAGNTARTPYLIEGIVDGNTTVFSSTGVSLFGPDAADLDDTVTEVVFTPLIMDADDEILTTGTPFSLSVERAEITVDTDVPVTDGLLRLWDARFAVDFGNRTWTDRVAAANIVFQEEEDSDLMVFRSFGNYTRFKVDAIRVTQNLIDLGQIDAAGDFGPLTLPPQWTICIMGYPTQDYSAPELDTAKIYDAQLGYTTTDQNGPFEGVYRYLDQGVKMSAPRVTVPGYNGSFQHCAVITSDTTLPELKVYTDDTLRATQAFDTSVNPILSKFFPISAISSVEFELGQIIIYNRVLTQSEINQYTDYAYDVWYDPEV